MNTEILDEIEKENVDNSKPIARIIQMSLGSVFLFYLIEKARDTLPVNVFEYEDIKFNTVGLLITVVIILNSILIPSNLNKIKPQLSTIQIVLFTGLVLIGIEVAFRLVQNFIIFQNGIEDLRYLFLTKSTVFIGLFSALVANIKIHKLRKKKTLIPNLLLIGLFIVNALYFRI